MFAITETAALAINALFSEIPEGAGLRIAQEPQHQREHELGAGQLRLVGAAHEPDSPRRLVGALAERIERDPDLCYSVHQKLLGG